MRSIKECDELEEAEIIQNVLEAETMRYCRVIMYHPNGALLYNYPAKRDCEICGESRFCTLPMNRLFTRVCTECLPLTQPTPCEVVRCSCKLEKGQKFNAP